MRRTLALALLLTTTLAASPASAEAEGRMFRRAGCGKVQCMNSSQDAMTYIKSIVAASNRCLANRLGKGSPNGFFETSFPDSSGCLATKPLPPNPNGGPTMSPKCCVVPVDGKPGECQLVCALHEKR